MILGLIILLILVAIVIVLSKEHKLIEFFEEGSGKISFMRLSSLICLYLLTVYVIQMANNIGSITGTGWGDVRVIVLLILMVGAFFPKLLQKIIEKKTSE
jgi:hypothetical protein